MTRALLFANAIYMYSNGKPRRRDMMKHRKRVRIYEHRLPFFGDIKFGRRSVEALGHNISGVPGPNRFRNRNNYAKT